MDKAKDTFVKTFTGVKEKWGGLAGKTRIIILAVTGVIIVSAIVITIVLNGAHYVPLYTASDKNEAREVSNFLAGAGYTDIKVSPANNIVLASDRYVAGELRMALAAEGYPRDSSSNFNNDIWNNGIDMFTTENQAKTTERLQMQAWLSATLNTISEVSAAKVILNVPVSKNYSFQENKEEPSASVMLTLKPGTTLTARQISGVHNLVRGAVNGIKEENIFVTDGEGIILMPSDGTPTLGEELSIQKQRFAMQAELTSTIQNNAEVQLNGLLLPAFARYSIAVNVEMDFNDVEGETTTYIPYAEGMDKGVLSDMTREYAAGGTALDSGPVGTFDNSDLSPEYPTIPQIQAGDEFYVDYIDKYNYEISKTFERYSNNGLKTAKVTASVFIDSEPLPDTDIAKLQNAIAKGIGANAEDVSVMAVTFPLLTPTGPEKGGLLAGDLSTRNMLIWIIIALGVLLVILFVLAIATSGSKKKRQIRYRGAPPLVDGTGQYVREDVFVAPPEPEGFDLPSLLEENETKDVVLKREIREFSKSNPEIIAQLIRTWLRGDE